MSASRDCWLYERVVLEGVPWQLFLGYSIFVGGVLGFLLLVLLYAFSILNGVSTALLR